MIPADVCDTDPAQQCPYALSHSRGSYSNLRMKIQHFSNIHHLLIHRFGPRPMNFILKQDIVKLHAIALPSMMTNTNVTVYYYIICFIATSLEHHNRHTSLTDFSVYKNKDFTGPEGTLVSLPTFV